MRAYIHVPKSPRLSLSFSPSICSPSTGSILPRRTEFGAGASRRRVPSCSFETSFPGGLTGNVTFHLRPKHVRAAFVPRFVAYDLSASCKSFAQWAGSGVLATFCKGINFLVSYRLRLESDEISKVVLDETDK